MKRSLILSLLFLVLFYNVNAQKLPNVQVESVIAPNLVRVDGKIEEWVGGLKAYNHSTNIFYTMANSADKLYLIVQTKDDVIAHKVLAGGITLTVNGNKDNNTGVSVTYPLLTDASRSGISYLMKEQPTANDAVLRAKQTDSLVSIINTAFNARAKEIKVTGITSTPDSILSIYNQYGIKAVAHFDNKRVLTYELAIPLKYLKTWDKFYYHIALNGIAASNSTIIHNNPHGVVMVTTVAGGLTSNSDFAVINYPTDFWGEYTLTK